MIKKKVKKYRGLWRRVAAGIGVLLLVVSAMPWSLWAKTESVTSVRGSGGYTAVNWEKSAFLPGDDFQVLNMEFHTTNEGNTAYCLQMNIGNPTDTEISYEEEGSEEFSQEALEAVKHVLANGYPMNQDMWGNIPAQGQREATQIAVWYVMSHFSQPGSGGKGEASSFSTILDEDCIRNATEHDVVGMARTLVQCGLTGKDLYSQSMSLEEVSVTEKEGKFEAVYRILGEGIREISGTVTGVKGEISLLIGEEKVPCKDGTFSWDCSGKMPEKLTLVADAFDNREGTVTVSLDGADVRNLPGIFFLRADGAYQKMAGVRLQKQVVVSDTCTTTLPGYVPPDTKIQIVKKDAETGEVISGAGFQIYRVSDGQLMVLQEGGDTMMYTGENGMLTTMPLPYDEYLVVEKEAPAGYLPAEPQLVSFSGRGEELVTVTVYDQLYRVSLLVQKKDGVTGVDICQAGVTYQLLDGEKNVLDLGNGFTFVTDEDGRLEIPYELPSGTYYLRETAAPAGYVKNPEDVKVEITCGQVAVTQNGKTAYAAIAETLEAGKYHYQAEFAVEDDPVILEVAKKHPFGESSLLGASLLLTAKEEIYGPDQTLIYRAGDEVRRWESGEEAEFFYAIPAGTYELSEEEAPLGYEQASPVDVVVRAIPEPQTAVITNLPQKFFVKVTKLGEEEMPLSGVTYELQYGEDVCEESGEIVFRKGQSVLDEDGDIVQLVTGVDGMAEVTGLCGWFYDSNGDALEELTYQLQETGTAKGYVLEKEPCVLTEEGWMEEREGWEVTLTNELQRGTILVKKSGLVSSYERVHPSDYGDIYSEEQAEIPLADVEFTVYADEACEVPLERIVTGLDGTGESSPLPIGTYYLKETRTPKGYLPNDSVYPCMIAGDDTGAETVESSVLTLVNESCEVTISFEKQGRARNEDGEWERFSLADAVFGLYRGNKMLESAVSSEEGTVTFTGHYPAGEYEVRELFAPEGFGMLDEAVKISLEPENQNLSLSLESGLFVNEAVKGKLMIEKVDGLSAPLSGVGFTLTNRETGEKLSGVTDEEGGLVWEDIPAGYQTEKGEFVYYHYDLKETRTPEGYNGMKETKEFVFDQENNGQKVVAIRTKVVNYEESLPMILGSTKLPMEVSLLMIALGALSGVLYYHIKKRWRK